MNKNLARYRELRKIPLDNAIAPPLYFNPIIPGTKIDRTKRPIRMSAPPKVERPKNLEDAAFWQVTQLAELIRTKQVTSAELTEMYLARLKKHNPQLLCAVTITDDLAMRLAREADQRNCRRPLSRPAPRHSLGSKRSRFRRKIIRPRGARDRSKIA